MNETDSDFEDPRVKKKKKKKSKKSSKNKDDSSDNSTIQYASDVFGNEMTSPTKRTVAGSQSKTPQKTDDSGTPSKTNALPDNFHKSPRALRLEARISSPPSHIPVVPVVDKPTFKTPPTR